jgi:hypothetical protein
MAQSTASSIESQLIEDLEKLSLVNRKLVKSTPYAAPADPNITVKSWKMNEFKYYQVPSPFPTLARGLFSIERPTESAGSKDTSGSHRIVIRGYDKFFNIGEVPWTTVRRCNDFFLLLRFSDTFNRSGLPSRRVPHRPMCLRSSQMVASFSLGRSRHLDS